jgi:hypothetical protein
MAQKTLAELIAEQTGMAQLGEFKSETPTLSNVTGQAGDFDTWNQPAKKTQGFFGDTWDNIKDEADRAKKKADAFVKPVEDSYKEVAEVVGNPSKATAGGVVNTLGLGIPGIVARTDVGRIIDSGVNQLGDNIESAVEGINNVLGASKNKDKTGASEFNAGQAKTPTTTELTPEQVDDYLANTSLTKEDNGSSKVTEAGALGEDTRKTLDATTSGASRTNTPTEYSNTTTFNTPETRENFTDAQRQDKIREYSDFVYETTGKYPTVDDLEQFKANLSTYDSLDSAQSYLEGQQSVTSDNFARTQESKKYYDDMFDSIDPDDYKATQLAQLDLYREQAYEQTDSRLRQFGYGGEVLGGARAEQYARVDDQYALDRLKVGQSADEQARQLRDYYKGASLGREDMAYANLQNSYQAGFGNYQSLAGGYNQLMQPYQQQGFNTNNLGLQNQLTQNNLRLQNQINQSNQPTALEQILGVGASIAGGYAGQAIYNYGRK